jgi:hypothetical protein
MLPKGRVAAMVDQGPVILANTTHSVIAGPYHRNERGILDTYRLFTGAPESGARILHERGIDYLMTCKTSPDYAFYLKQSGTGSLLHLLDVRKDPPWLKRMDPPLVDQKVEVFRIDRAKLPS